MARGFCVWRVNALPSARFPVRSVTGGRDGGRKPSLASLSGPDLRAQCFRKWEVPMGYPRLTPSDGAPPARVPRPGADPISLTARRFARHRPQQPQPTQLLSGVDQLALSRIAERFAPGAQQAPASDLREVSKVPEAPKVVEAPKAPEATRNQHSESEAPQSPAAVATLSGMRALIA